MATTLSLIYKRSRYIILHGGLWTFFRRSLIYFKGWFFQNATYFVYRADIDLTQQVTEPKHQTDFALKIIYDLKEYDQLINEGYSFRHYYFQPLLADGGIAFTLFANKCLIYHNWIAFTEKAKIEIDNVPFKVDFNNGEVCLGGSFTEPKYRNMGLHSYVLSIMPNILIQKGVKTSKYSIKKGNIASIKAFSKFNHRLISQWRHLKILWWESWKEVKVNGENAQWQETNIINDQIFTAGMKIYLKTPTTLKFIFRLIAYFKNYFHIRVDQWILTGGETNRENGVEVLYGGSIQNKNYLANLIFGDSYKEEYLGNRWFWDCFGDSKKKFGCSLSITDIPAPFKPLIPNRNGFFIPDWVDGEIDLSDDIASLVDNDWSLRYNHRKVQKNQYCYEVTHDPTQMGRFYYDMYLPHVRASYGNKALITSYKEVKPKFANYELLLVKQQGQDLAGALLFCTNKEAVVDLIGVKDGNTDYVRNGVLAALYYFTFCYLQSKGYKKVKMGATRAFLKDGVLTYKKKWGLNISHASGMLFSVRVLSLTGGASAFLLNNPFIFYDKTGYNGAFFIGPDQSISENDLENIKNKYQIKGMRNLHIIRLEENDIKFSNFVTLPISVGIEKVRTEPQSPLS